MSFGKLGHFSRSNSPVDRDDMPTRSSNSPSHPGFHSTQPPFHRGGDVLQFDLSDLKRDPGSSFHRLLPPPHARLPTSRGFSPENFLPLPEATADECRAFYELVHCSPLEYMYQSNVSHSMDLRRLVDAALFAHTYQMPTYRTCALILIKNMDRFCFVNQIHSDPALRDDLLQLTFLCGRARYTDTEKAECIIRGRIHFYWMSLMGHDPLNNGTFEALREALDIAERYDFGPLLGSMYQLYLCRMMQQQPQAHVVDGTTPWPVRFTFPDPALSVRHQHGLAFGHLSLYQCWQQFAATVIPLPDTNACGHRWQSDLNPTCAGRQTCADRWAICWRTAAVHPTVQNIEFYDIFRKLEAFRNKVNDLYAYDRGCCGLPRR
ncbi:hypothetical protein B0H13DRAFT_2058153, partial [Mycena leptocephala]